MEHRNWDDVVAEQNSTMTGPELERYEKAKAEEAARLRGQTQAVEAYVDRSMYPAAPMEPGAKGPSVFLLWMTPDPLGAIAAACRMYEGKPTYSLGDITDAERQHYGQQVQKTHLKAPLEFVKFHFFIEGVDRAFTHQIVRQRTAVFAQESLRFAVKHDMASEVLVPPSILTGGQDVLETFENLMKDIENKYNWFVANGIPAEDARAILPHATSTRLHYCTDLRNLADHAGNRLCTQAQFIWRKVFSEIVDRISEQAPDLTALNLFKPVCYQLGHCPFTADFDRGCTIRGRVTELAKFGIPSSEWDSPSASPDRIRQEEWMLNPRAAYQ